MKSYDHSKIEKKWQKFWDENKVYKTLDAKKATTKGIKPYYVLDMFPYPSGSGLHVGHPRGYIASDVFARMKRMQGFNVLHPMGFDSFGLPAEQYAIQTGKNPATFTEQLVKRYKTQLSILGLSYDWDRQVATHDPKYYKWTQWIFLQIYNSWYDTKKKTARPITELEKIFETKGNKSVTAWTQYANVFTAKEWNTKSEIEKQDILMNYRLAYEGYAEVNWCPELGTVLANDEVVEKNGRMVSERGDFPVEKKSMRQWFMRITAYGDRLLSGLETIDWSHSIKEIQKNWIGKSEGAEIGFELSHNKSVTVFTTRPDTLFGVTYVVLAPEYQLVQDLKSNIKNWKEVESYIETTKRKDDMTRTANEKDKTGVKLDGIFAINPANGESVPVWIADYVLANYGTGAVMGVPMHDERDNAFATKYGIDIFDRPLVDSKDIVKKINGKWVTKYKFRDAIFARQRYWGEPIPLIHENAPLKVFFLKSSLQKGYDKELSKLSVSKSLHEDWGINYFVDEKNLSKFIKTAQKLLLDKKNDIWYFDVSGSQQLVCYKKKIFDVTDPIQNELAKQHGRLGGIPEEQLDWKVQKTTDNRIIKEVPEKQLPLELPKVKSYAPAGTGGSPLATVKSWVTAGYETNTMPGWAGSSWYFLRYTDPKNAKKFADNSELDYWFGKNGGVNMYVGGAEHATGHLLYSRFWHKVLHDLGHVKSEEPFMKLRNQGMIGGADGRKMSKRWGNVVNPDDVVKQFGADTLRVYETFVGPFESDLPWSTDGIVGSRRFIERIWRFQEKVSETAKTSIELQKSLHKTVKKVTDDIASFSFNTAISAMMIFANELEKHEFINVKDFKKFIQVLAPFAPYITDELWNMLGEKKTIHCAPWPVYDPKLIVDDTFTIGVQINGKVRAEITISNDISQSLLEEKVYAMNDVIKWIDGKQIKKFIYVPGRIINIVV